MTERAKILHVVFDKQPPSAGRMGIEVTLDRPYRADLADDELGLYRVTDDNGRDFSIAMYGRTLANSGYWHLTKDEEVSRVDEAEMRTTVAVDASDLREILMALVGPGHLVRELQAIRSLGNSPIDRIVDQFNSSLTPASSEPATPDPTEVVREEMVQWAVHVLTELQDKALDTARVLYLKSRSPHYGERRRASFTEQARRYRRIAAGYARSAAALIRARGRQRNED